MHKCTKAFGNEMKALVKRKSAMATAPGVAGGYLVPTELLVGVDAALMECSVFHMRAFRRPMTTMQCDLGAFDLGATHVTGQSPMFGGMYVGWGKEGAKLPENDPSFQGGQLVANPLQAQIVASNQLVEDGGEALGAYLESGFTRAIVWGVERGCLQGNGVDQPLGVINAPGTLKVTRAGSGHVAAADLSGMVAGLLPACYRNAIWMCNPTTLSDIAKFGAYQVQGSMPGSLCGYIFGRPLYVTENLPAIGTLGDVILFDPTLYVLGERSVEIAASTQALFNTNQTVFRLIWRGDGQPLVRKTFTIADDVTTCGCYVALN